MKVEVIEYSNLPDYIRKEVRCRIHEFTTDVHYLLKGSIPTHFLKRGYDGIRDFMMLQGDTEDLGDSAVYAYLCDNRRDYLTYIILEELPHLKEIEFDHILLDTMW